MEIHEIQDFLLTCDFFNDCEILLVVKYLNKKSLDFLEKAVYLKYFVFTESLNFNLINI